MGKNKGHISRRTMLKSLALAAGGLAALPVLARIRSKKPRTESPLPGEGSIFQPRHDARFKDWVQTHPNSRS
jgi:hypothetical protein